MINSPIIIGGTKLPELTNPGAAGDLLAGKQLIDQYGNPLTGTIPTKSAADLTANGAAISVPAGYYPSAVSKGVAAAVQATPAISVSNTGLITASAEQAAGYVAEGTKRATLQLTTQAAQTITPGTANKTIASGRYLTGVQTIKGDANLKAENIKSGVSIFGVAGTFTGSNNAYVIEKTYSVDTTNTISFTGLPFTPSRCLIVCTSPPFTSGASGRYYIAASNCRASDGVMPTMYAQSNRTYGYVSTSGFAVSGTTATINLVGTKVTLYLLANETYYFVFC